MHVVSLLKSQMFDVRVDGKPAATSDIFPDWHVHDRFGLVIDEPFGGIGATHLLQLAMTLFYDIKPSRRTTLAVYPEIYAFHIGKGHGAHAPYDFWPARREVILSNDHREILDAINDRGITRLAVPERQPRQVTHRPKEADAALDRLVSAFVYRPDGRISNGDVVIAGNDKRTEYNPRQALRPFSPEGQTSAVSTSARPVKETDTSYQDWLQQRSSDVSEDQRLAIEQRREHLRQNGTVWESYRRIGIADALATLAGAGSPARDAESIG
jgi:hypothetical protein